MRVTKTFDVDKAIFGLRSFGTRFSNEMQFDAARPMGNVGMDLVSNVAMAGFVGLFEEVKDVLPKCVDWLRNSIDSRESFGETKEFYLSRWNQALALANWMQDGSVNEGAWGAAVREDQAAIAISKDIYPEKHLKTVRLDHIMPMCLLAGSYDLAISQYEGVDRAVTSRAPKASPRRYAYGVARCRMGLEEFAELQSMGDTVIAKNMDEYLAYGKFIEAATLVCLVRSKVEGSVDAIGSLRSAIQR